MATRKPAPVDQRAIDLARIDDETARLEKLLASKRETLAANERLHPLDQDAVMQQRIKSEIGHLEGLIGKQREYRFRVEIGEAEAVVAPQPKAAPVQRRAWDIKNLPEPTYPAGARQAGDGKALAIGLASFVEY